MHRQHIHRLDTSYLNQEAHNFVTFWFTIFCQPKFGFENSEKEIATIPFKDNKLEWDE